MKKILLLLAMTFYLWTITFAQTKVYAYAQPVVSGVSPQGIIDETGKQIKKPRSSKFNYYLFIRHKASKDIKPVAVYMKNGGWQVNFQPVDSTPVYITDVKFPLTPQKVMLVPKTTKKVLSLQMDLDKSISNNPSRKLARKLKKSEIVFEYTQGGKTKYKSLKKITVLDPVATM